MIVEDDHYFLPTIPRELAERLNDKENWTEELRSRYSSLRKQFTSSKAEFATWIRRDRDSRMNRTAKQILLLIVDCLNFETGRCDPGHQYIADELGVSVRTVERTIPRISRAGWISVTRRGKTSTNFYRLGVSTKKVAAILDYADSLREQRAEERERRRFAVSFSDPTKLADHSISDPTFLGVSDPTELADHDPTKLAGKYMNRTPEDEHLKDSVGSEEEEHLNGSPSDAHGSYLSAHNGDEANAPLPIPRDEFEAEDMMAAICAGVEVHPSVRSRMMFMLNRGVLTPNLASGMIGKRKEVPRDAA